MSIWGKLADVAAELARGDPIGALRSGVGHQEQNGSALGAKMAKADGIVTDDEINAFKEVFKVPPGARPDPRHADDAD
jgi:DnaJ like chaperone protein